MSRPGKAPHGPGSLAPMREPGLRLRPVRGALLAILLVALLVVPGEARAETPTAPFPRATATVAPTSKVASCANCVITDFRSMPSRVAVQVRDLNSYDLVD